VLTLVRSTRIISINKAMTSQIKQHNLNDWKVRSFKHPRLNALMERKISGSHEPQRVSDGETLTACRNWLITPEQLGQKFVSRPERLPPLPG